jgi:predicted nucleotidyltransferase component of viral defense system
LAVGSRYPLVITGGYAVQAHGLANRLSHDLDVATESQIPMEEIAAVLSAGLADKGWTVRQLDADPLSARLIVTSPATGEDCEVDVLKEVFWQPPHVTEYGPVLALDDVIGTKVRALADRGAVRDLIDVHAASGLHANSELEALGRRHARDEFSLEDLAMRLGGAEWYEDEAFAAYGVSDGGIAELRAWAQAWADDIGRRLGLDAAEDDS